MPEVVTKLSSHNSRNLIRHMGNIIMEDARNQRVDESTINNCMYTEFMGAENGIFKILVGNNPDNKAFEALRNIEMIPVDNIVVNWKPVGTMFNKSDEYRQDGDLIIYLEQELQPTFLFQAVNINKFVIEYFVDMKRISDIENAYNSMSARYGGIEFGEKDTHKDESNSNIDESSSDSVTNTATFEKQKNFIQSYCAINPALNDISDIIAKINLFDDKFVTGFNVALNMFRTAALQKCLLGFEIDSEYKTKLREMFNDKVDLDKEIKQLVYEALMTYLDNIQTDSDKGNVIMAMFNTPIETIKNIQDEVCSYFSVYRHMVKDYRDIDIDAAIKKFNRYSMACGHKELCELYNNNQVFACWIMCCVISIINIGRDASDTK